MKKLFINILIIVQIPIVILSGPPPSMVGDAVQERWITPGLEIVPFVRKREQNVFYFLWLRSDNDKAHVNVPDSDGWSPSVAENPIDIECNEDVYFGYNEGLNTPENERQFVETIDGKIYGHCVGGAGGGGVASDKQFDYQIVETDMLVIFPAKKFAAVNSREQFSTYFAEHVTSTENNSLVDALWTINDSALEVTDESSELITNFDTEYDTIWISANNVGLYTISAQLPEDESVFESADLHVAIDLKVDSNNDGVINNDDDLLESDKAVNVIKGTLEEMNLVVDSSITDRDNNNK